MSPLFWNRTTSARGRAWQGTALLVVMCFALLALTPAAAAGLAQGPDTTLPPWQLEPPNLSYVAPPNVTFRWTPTEGASSYALNIYREDNMWQGLTIHVPAPLTSVTYSELEAGYTYIWNVEADVPTDGTNYYFWEFTLSAQPIPPRPLDEIHASDGGYRDEVEVYWGGTKRTTYYVLQRRAPGSADFVDMTLIAANAELVYHDEDVQTEVRYQYRVLSCNSAGCSVPSPVDEGWSGTCQPIAAPRLKSPADGAEFFFTRQDPDYYLNWEPVPNALGYWVYVWDYSGDHDVITDYVDNADSDAYMIWGQGGHLSWTVISANPVRGCPNSTMEQKWSFYAILKPPPPVPVNVRASDGQYPDKVVISWDEPPSDYYVESSEIWRSTQPDVKTAQQLQEIYEIGPYEDTTATPGTLYYYWITACSHSDGCSEKSRPDSGWAGEPPLDISYSFYLPMIER